MAAKTEDNRLLTAITSVSDDAYSLFTRLRKADLEELKAGRGVTPLEALLQGIHNSDHCFTILNPWKVPLAIFGTVPTADPNYSIIWMLGSDELVDYKIEFLRRSRKWIDRLHLLTKSPILGNWVDARNGVHIKWLKWVGCNFVNKLNMGVEQLPFLEFMHLGPVKEVKKDV